MVPMEYLTNFWRTLEMPLINSEINLILTWFESCVQSDPTTNQAAIFTINWYKTLSSSCNFFKSG